MEQSQKKELRIKFLNKILRKKIGKIQHPHKVILRLIRKAIRNINDTEICFLPKRKLRMIDIVNQNTPSWIARRIYQYIVNQVKVERLAPTTSRVEKFKKKQTYCILKILFPTSQNQINDLKEVKRWIKWAKRDEQEEDLQDGLIKASNNLQAVINLEQLEFAFINIRTPTRSSIRNCLLYYCWKMIINQKFNFEKFQSKRTNFNLFFRECRQFEKLILPPIKQQTSSQSYSNFFRD